VLIYCSQLSHLLSELPQSKFLCKNVFSSVYIKEWRGKTLMTIKTDLSKGLIHSNVNI
jgi:hypothetical protein